MNLSYPMVVIPEKPEKLDEEAVGCIITFESKYLLTHRVKDNLWGSVAETMEEGEAPEAAVRRGLETELGIQATPTFFTTTYHQYGDRKIAYHIFELELENGIQDIEFNKSEIKALWLLPLSHALQRRDLYEDEDYCLELHHKQRMQP